MENKPVSTLANAIVLCTVKSFNIGEYTHRGQLKLAVLRRDGLFIDYPVFIEDLNEVYYDQPGSIPKYVKKAVRDILTARYLKTKTSWQ